jgi:cholesterol transport system auxiliary component
MPLGGCSLLVGQPAPQLYRLTPLAVPTARGPSPHTQLVVDTPVAPQSLDTDRIALTRSPTRLDYYADAAWTDRAPVLLQGLLVEAFENTGRLAAVGRDAGTLTPDYLLETELRDFEARYAGPHDRMPIVVLRLVSKLVRVPARQLTASLLVTEQEPAAGSRLDSVVEAFDAATGRAIARVVDWSLRIMLHRK